MSARRHWRVDRCVPAILLLMVITVSFDGCAKVENSPNSVPKGDEPLEDTTISASALNETVPTNLQDPAYSPFTWIHPYPTVTLPAEPNPSVPTPEAMFLFLDIATFGDEDFTPLWHRIERSDVIVKSRLRGIVPESWPNCDINGDLKTWDAVVQFQFEVMEYLKGSGATQIAVNVGFGGNAYDYFTVYEAQKDARLAAQIRIMEMDRSLDEYEAILFLVLDDYDWDNGCVDETSLFPKPHNFTLEGYKYAPEYWIDSRQNRVWLPAIEGYESVKSGRTDDGVDDLITQRFRLSIDSIASTKRDYRSDMEGTVSIDELRNEIANMHWVMEEDDGQ